MIEESIHAHSKLAFNMLSSYRIGTLDEATISDTPTKAPDTDFIDITKPMFLQVLNSTYSREFYLENSMLLLELMSSSSQIATFKEKRADIRKCLDGSHDENVVVYYTRVLAPCRCISSLSSSITRYLCSNSIFGRHLSLDVYAFLAF
jgi:hypothetical protein